jgi:hypothetical protein
MRGLTVIDREFPRSELAQFGEAHETIGNVLARVTLLLTQPNWVVPADLSDALGVEPAVLQTRMQDERVRVLERLAVEGVPTGTDEPPTVWWHGERSYSQDGKNPTTFGLNEDYILQAFMRTGTSLATQELKEKSGMQGNLAKVMKQLEKKLGAAVRRPGVKGPGYFIPVRPLAPGTNRV